MTGTATQTSSSWGEARLPHPIPYQGSKRQLASEILANAGAFQFRTLYEPFAGSGAVTIAAAARQLAAHYALNDSFGALAALWQRMVGDPQTLADQYRLLWEEQFRDDPIAHYLKTRDRFNATGDPAMLLYLLARCVKNAPRFNKEGAFNQSPDKRRHGMKPDKMRREILGVWALLRDRVSISASDFEDAIAEATPGDLVYMDPPYQGVSTGRDRRYHQGVLRDRVINALRSLNARNVPFLLSYDGSCGGRDYGDPLPEDLGVRLQLQAGVSSQGTLSGRHELTVESLYVSNLLAVNCEVLLARQLHSEPRQLAIQFSASV